VTAVAVACKGSSVTEPASANVKLLVVDDSNDDDDDDDDDKASSPSLLEVAFRVTGGDRRGACCGGRDAILAWGQENEEGAVGRCWVARYKW